MQYDQDVASFTDIVQIADEASPPKGQNSSGSIAHPDVPDQTAKPVDSHPTEPSVETDPADDDSEETNDFRIVSHSALVETTTETRRASKRIRSQDHADGGAETSDRHQGERYDWREWSNQDLSAFGAKLGKEILSRLRSSGKVEEDLANSLSEWKAKYEDLLNTSAAEKMALSDELKTKEEEFQTQLATANQIKSDLEKMVDTLEKERDSLKSKLPEHIAEAIANYRRSDELADSIKMLFAPIIWFGYSSAIEDMKAAGLNVDATKLSHAGWNRNDGSQIYETRFKEFRDGVDLVSKYGKRPPPAQTGSSSQSQIPPSSK